MSSNLLKVIQIYTKKNKKHYKVIFYYCRVQMFSAKINLPSKNKELKFTKLQISDFLHKIL